MPSTPYAKLQVRVNGGAPMSGGITVAIGDTIQFQAESTVGWSSPGAPAPEWELYGYPEGFLCPAGWTAVTVEGFTVYRFTGLGPPSSFQVTVWGKYMPALRVAGGGGQLTDESTALTVPSPLGLEDLGHRETSQFGGAAEMWARDHRRNLRVIETGFAGAVGTPDPTPDTLFRRDGTGSGAVVDLSAQTVTLGAAPANSGDIRASEGFALKVANAGQTESRTAIEAIAGDGVAIGDATDVDLVQLRVAGSGFIAVEVGGVEAARIAATYLQVGAVPAGAGYLRIPNGGAALVARNAANDGDLSCVATDVSDNVFVGQQPGENGNLYLQTRTGGLIYGYAGTNQLFYTAAGNFRLNVASFYWSPSVVNPAIFQSDAVGAVGQVTSVRAQNAPSGTGGDLTLSSGSGASAAQAGDMQLRTGGVDRLTITTTGAVLADSMYLRFGSAAASTGTVRLENGASIDVRNLAGDGDIKVVSSFNDDLIFGEGATNVGLLAANSFSVEAGGDTSLAIVGQNTGLGGTPSAGGGTRVVFVADADVVPTTNPTNGVIIYSEGGAAKVRGASGTITTFGPAEPHCPSCGRDFAHEWRSTRTGEHLAICLPCMLHELESAGVNVTAFAFINTLEKP